MTVLVAFGSAEGIAIAADGRRMNADRTFKTDEAQKVWHNRSADHWDLVVGWAGSSEIEAGSVCFSFPKVSEAIWRTLELGRLPEAFFGFANLMQTQLQMFLDLHVNPHPSRISPDEIRAESLMGAFLGGMSICAAIVFHVENGRAKFTQPIVETVIGGYSKIQSGSGTLWEKRPKPDSGHLSEAIKDAHEYIQECISGRGQIPDCADYGGRIHIGVVDANGFRWEP
jgi:hypothetical protein